MSFYSKSRIINLLIIKKNYLSFKQATHDVENNIQEERRSDRQTGHPISSEKLHVSLAEPICVIVLRTVLLESILVPPTLVLLLWKETTPV